MKKVPSFLQTMRNEIHCAITLSQGSQTRGSHGVLCGTRCFLWIFK